MRIDRPKKVHRIEDALTINMRSFSLYRSLSREVRGGMWYRGISIGLIIAIITPLVVPVVVHAEELDSIVEKSTPSVEVVGEEDQGFPEVVEEEVQIEEVTEEIEKDVLSEEVNEIAQVEEVVEEVVEEQVTEEVSTSTPEVVIPEVVATSTATSTEEVPEEVENDSSNATTTESVVIDPADLVPPEITIIGNNPAIVPVGTSYVDQGVLVNDNKSNNLGHRIRVNGLEVDAVALDTSTTSEYAITYVATDQDGNVSVAVRTVIVGEIGLETEDIGAISSSTIATTTPNTNEAQDGEKEIVYVEVEKSSSNTGKHVFSEADCISVAEGEYYCVNKAVSTSTTISIKEPHVFVAQQSGGDKEIYFYNGNTTVNITDNNYDDDRPVYDSKTGIIVWQSLRDDRYQIISYNTLTGIETQITSTGYNSVNPHTDNGLVVWQGWVNNNWEIFISNTDTPADSDLEPITQNAWNDMFPQVKNNIVTWQSRVNDSWRVFVYDLVSGEISEVAVPAGGKVENPRFVILVENRKENGDVESYAYDVTTKETFPLGAKAREESQEEVPSPLHDEAVLPPHETRVVRDESEDSPNTDL